MAVKFGMTVLEIIGQLTRGFMKAMGRKPDGLEKIKIQQEAVQRFKDMNKVVDMEGNVLDPSKPIMGGTQEGAALKSGIMKATGAKPMSVKTKNRPDVYDLDDYDTTNMSDIKKEIIRTETKLGNLNPDSPGFKERAKPLIDKLTELQKKLRDDKAMGGRIGLKEGEGIMQMASMDDDYEAEFMKLVGEFMERGFSQQEAIDAARDELERLRDKFTSAPDPKDERNTMMENIAIQEFGKPLKDLSEDEIIQIEEMMEEMTKIDRGAPSITLADGGRAAFKDGKIAGFFKSLRPFSSKNKYTNQLEGILYGSEGLSEGLQLLSQLPFFAEGGRIGYKDGPKDPRRRTFMKIAGGLASILPFGIGKGVKMAAPVVAKAAEISGPALAKLVETVMSAGKLISVAGKRVKEMVTKKKLGKVEVTEDIQDGSYIIKKDGKEIYYKPGRQDESGGFDEDIIEVIEKRIEKAGGGGIGYMLGE